MKNRASLDPIVWSSFALLMLVFGLLEFALARQTAAENAALKQDLAKAQTRLDQFYGPAENTVKLDGMWFKAVPELGRTDSGYLVLKFSRVDFTEMCQASFREVANDTWEKVGKPFLCPEFEPSR